MEQDFKGPQIETQIEIPKAKKWVELSDYKTDEKNTFWEGLTGGSIWQTLVTGMPGWWNRDKTKIEREEGNGIVSAPSLQHYHQNLDSETQKPTKQVKIPHAYNSYWDSAVFLECVCVCVCARAHAKSLQLCPSLCDPVDYSLPGSSVHGILQARILEWVAIPSSRGSSWLRDWNWISYTGRQIPYHWATREAHSTITPWL